MNPQTVPGKSFPDDVLADYTKTPRQASPEPFMKNERSLTLAFVVVCMGWIRLYIPS